MEGTALRDGLSSRRPNTVLRIALGIVFVHFGLLKFFPDLSPAELLASQTVMKLSLNWLEARTALQWIAILECAIGLGLIFGVFLRWVFFLFLLHMAGTFTPLVFLPELTFKISPLAPTLEGQYILKNIVFVAAGWKVLAPHVGWRHAPAAPTPEIPGGNRDSMNDTARSALKNTLLAVALVGLGIGIAVTYEKYRGTDLSRVPEPRRAAFAQSAPDAESDSAPAATPRPVVSRDLTAELTLYPTITKGMRTPFDLWRYYGRGTSSFTSPTLPMRFEQWLDFHRRQKPKLMKDVRAYMAGRYDFSGTPMPGRFMSGGKPIMQGPVARLPDGVASFEALAELSPAEIRRRDVFPYKPLAHPLQSTAHMLFPQAWVEAHPQHERIDVDMDIPDAYLPEFPPPMFLTTHKELGDVTNGREVTLDNFYEIFDGLLTPEQMEGLKELLRPTPTTWFNHTTHRITEKPSKGVACLDCHVNGHTNGAIELGPDSRPNMARLRVDTPSMRGNFNLMQLSSKRSIRSMDHFAEVEEYFDGDPGMQQAIGPRAAKREVTNRMGDFNAILDFPPAPKLDPLMRLIPELATEAELRGEALFHGKAQCSKCHYGPAFVDDYLHDLRVERFFVCRPEGPIKTFPLRGIKDSPPYLHDGRAPTLHDAVEFFNLVLQLRLTKREKDDLVQYLLCL